MDMEGGRLDNVGKMSSQVITNTSGDVNLVTAVALSDADATLTAANMTGSRIFTITPTVARTLTVATAANLIGQLTGYEVGANFAFTVINTEAFDVTLTTNTGVTLVGKMIVNNGSGTWRIRVDSASAVTIYTEAAIAAAVDTLTTIAPVATTSGTAINFTGIPSWVQRITVNFNRVSLNGAGVIIVRVGNSGGIVTSGYVSRVANIGGQDTVVTSGFNVRDLVDSTEHLSGPFVLTQMENGVWSCFHVLSIEDQVLFGAGRVTGAGTVDRIRVTTVGGSAVFDVGSVGITYE